MILVVSSGVAPAPAASDDVRSIGRNSVQATNKIIERDYHLWNGAMKINDDRWVGANAIRPRFDAWHCLFVIR